ncbi:MAG: hypothetical protein V3T72_15435 [Thermoanaerobaculia bacterium]
MQHLLHGLNSSEIAMIAAEDAHLSLQVVVSRLQSDRDEAVAVNYGKLVLARQGLGLHGESRQPVLQSAVPVHFKDDSLRQGIRPNRPDDPEGS